jgi:hypothetical protein
MKKIVGVGACRHCRMVEVRRKVEDREKEKTDRETT